MTSLLCQPLLLSFSQAHQTLRVEGTSHRSHHFTRTFALALFLSVSRALSHSLFYSRGVRVGFSGIFGCSSDWSGPGGVTVQPKDARLVPLSGLASAGSGARQGLLHPGAGQGVPLHDLLDMFLFFALQNAQEVLQLRHGEGVPLLGGREEEMMDKSAIGEENILLIVRLHVH